MAITANMITPEQLEQNIGMKLANADQWCWSMHNVGGLPACPDPGLFGFPIVDNVRQPPQITATAFLDALRAYQVSIDSAYIEPGGGSAVQPNGAPVGISGGDAKAYADATAGMGLFGLTNCKFCQWLMQNPWIVLVVALGGFALFMVSKD